MNLYTIANMEFYSTQSFDQSLRLSLCKCRQQYIIILIFFCLFDIPMIYDIQSSRLISVISNHIHIPKEIIQGHS